MATLPIVMLKGVDAFAPERPTAARRDFALRLLPQLDPGDILIARVEAKLPDGNYRIVIGGQSLRMALPGEVAPDDTLELEFIARDPRPLFALRSVTQAGGTPAPQLSAAGRLLAMTSPPPGSTAPPLVAAGAKPLIGATPSVAAELSGALAHTLEQSGLFYESHQAQWLDGKRDLAQIRDEPQARLTREPVPREVAQRILGAPATSAAADDGLAATLQPKASIDVRTLPIVQQQLAALDGARCALQLEIWPGQWMRWEIEDQVPQSPAEPRTVPEWTTALHLDLPRLGGVHARLTLGGDGLRVHVATDAPASAECLRARLAALAQAFADAKLALASLSVAPAKAA